MGNRPMTEVDRINQQINLTLYHYDRFPEADDRINHLCRQLVEAVRLETGGPAGVAWLYQISDPDRPAVKAVGPDHDPITNFSADYVVPTYDHDLMMLIADRLHTPYTGTPEDSRKVERIMDRVRELGGHSLVWS